LKHLFQSVSIKKAERGCDSFYASMEIITIIGINLSPILHYKEWPAMAAFCHIHNFTVLTDCYNATVWN